MEYPQARHKVFAAKWLLDHPISARSIDQGASQSKGDAKEYHFSKEDLRALASSTPAAAPAAAAPAAPSASKSIGLVRSASAPFSSPSTP